MAIAYPISFDDYKLESDWGELKNAVKLDFVDPALAAFNGYWFAVQGVERADTYRPPPPLPPPLPPPAEGEEEEEEEDGYESPYSYG